MSERGNFKKYIIAALIFAGVVLAPDSSSGADRKMPSYLLSGIITSLDNKEPLEMVLIRLSNSDWAMTDQNGKFVFPSLPAGTYKYEISYLGFETRTGEIEVNRDIPDFNFVLRPEGLGLEEVVVTAEESKLGSTSRIGQAAIQHLQPKSVEDMLQLLPGMVTKNPDLTNAGQASLREIDSGGDANNSLGTAVFVDGAPVSNDANMQIFSTSRSGNNSSLQMNTMNDQTTSGRGTDLRSISPDNIESIEVIRGIPSAEYGNLTSGAIIIKTKVGTTPYEAKVKVDPNSKLFYAGKGLTLKNDNGALNFSIDYTQSYADRRKRFQGYDRITGNAAYSKVFMQESTPLSLNLKFSYYRNISSVKGDESMEPDEELRNENQGFRFSADGIWRLNKSWITNFSYSASLSYSKQQDIYKRYVGNGVVPYPSTFQSGEYVVNYLPAQYLASYNIDGEPLTAFVQLKANKMIPFNIGSNDIKVGAEYSLSVNKGEGMQYDINRPPVQGDGQSVRPRSYKSIPGMHTMSYFLENNTELNFAGTTFTLQAGVRVNTLFVDPLALRGNITTIDPRINASYQFLSKENNSVFNDLSIVGGFGIASKMPSMSYLYPNPAYYDYISFNSYVSGDASRTLGVITTNVIDNTANPNLKPSTSYKYEIGLSGRINRIRGSITYFNERYENEYGYTTVPYMLGYNKYTIPTAVAADALPFYQDGAVWYNTPASTVPQQADVYYQKEIKGYSMPSNVYRTLKHGIEYSFNFGEIKPLKTDVIVDGAWFYIKRRSTGYSYNSNRVAYQEDGQTRFNSYLAVLPAGSGTEQNRVNTNFRFVTHIPAVKLVFTTTVQVVWYESARYIYEDDNGNNLYYKTSNANGEILMVDPIGFYDKNMNFIPWDRSYEGVVDYTPLPAKYANLNYFETQKYPITCMLNFKLTKEFKRFVDLSFIANNFLKINKMYRQDIRGGYRELYTPMYFGAELKIKI